jgi:hypothetical protein
VVVSRCSIGDDEGLSRCSTSTWTPRQPRLGSANGGGGESGGGRLGADTGGGAAAGGAVRKQGRRGAAAAGARRRLKRGRGAAVRGGYGTDTGEWRCRTPASPGGARHGLMGSRWAER